MNLPVWLYWEGSRPEWISLCHDTVFAHATDVRIITPEHFDTLRTSERDIDISHLCIAHRADFIRAFLLAKFGGIWIDADCMVMRSLQPIFDLLDNYDFAGYKERSGFVTNNFMAARPGSIIAQLYYKNICDIIVSKRKIEWLTLGSNALTTTIRDSNVPWYELETSLIQPICWSNPKAFFEIRAYCEHEAAFNNDSYCYMLSSNMINGVISENPSMSLLTKNSFFDFLFKKSMDNSILGRIAYRKDTDDDRWVIPEVIVQDMYRLKDVLSALSPDRPQYVIDCGAHIGAFSVMCSRYIKNVEVISFEPNPDSFSYLYRNAANFGNIRAINKAVDIKEGSLSLFAPEQDDWNGRWTVLPNNNKQVTVEAINLFSFINELDKPVFLLKMDLEGYEEFILNNCNEVDLRNIKMIVVETHIGQLDHNKLISQGFKLLFQPNVSADRQFVYSRMDVNSPAIV